MEASAKAPVSKSAPVDLRERLRFLMKILSEKEFAEVPPMVPKILERLYQEPEIDHQQISYVTSSILRCDPQMRVVMTLSAADLNEVAPAFLYNTTFLKAVDTPLLHEVLRKTILKDLKLEQVLWSWRRIYLHLLSNWDFRFNFTAHAEFMISLALQCFKNEYFYSTSQEDRDRVELLKQLLELELLECAPSAPSEMLLAGLTVYGMYAPLWTLPSHTKILQIESLTPSLELLVKDQIVNPLEEREIQRGIESLGTTQNQVSSAVSTQYENFPYPRWFSLPSKPPRSFDSWLSERFPHLGKITFATAPEILVAGCGTGRHAITLARKFPDANVLAVDLSKASLAYAMRNANALGVDNITFAHADILSLEDLDRRFHSVEAVGVIHHIGDPVRAWRILSGLLVPGGFMRLGLYSKLGRDKLNPAKTFVRDRLDRHEDLADIRTEMIRNDSTGQFKPALQTHDSFTRSEFKDLLCHAHEVQFTLPQIAGILAELELEFVGFEYLSDDVQKAFEMEFPDVRQRRDLKLWHKFEMAHPETFESMYRFWVRS
jgi:SAM-dependent methyltransferase